MLTTAQALCILQLYIVYHHIILYFYPFILIYPPYQLNSTQLPTYLPTHRSPYRTKQTTYPTATPNQASKESAPAAKSLPAAPSDIPILMLPSPQFHPSRETQALSVHPDTRRSGAGSRCLCCRCCYCLSKLVGCGFGIGRICRGCSVFRHARATLEGRDCSRDDRKPLI